MTEGIGLSPAWVARKLVAYDELRAAVGSLWWLQSDPDHGGCRRVMCADRSGTAVAVTPPEVSVGGQLHAYGGGAFAVTSGGVWFVGDDGSLFRQPAGGTPERIVSTVGSEQYGDLAPAAEGGLLAVRGDDTVDEIVAVSPVGRTRVLVRSRGFLACPRQAGDALAYVKWQRDRMPWDSSRLMLANMRSDAIEPGRVVVGGPEESVVQPSWGPDGLLYFMSDRTGWWNLYRLRDGVVEAVASIDADCAPAPWEGGYQSYGFAADGTVVLTVMKGFTTDLLAVGVEGGRRRLGSNLTSVKPYIAVDGHVLTVIGSTASSPPAIWSIDLAARADSPAVPLGRASESGVPWTPVPPSLETAAAANGPVHFLLHRPPGGARPVPLLVRAHPGPTDDVPLRLDWASQFFVSHGFAVAEVLYRGSTGLGRAFRQALHGHWGDYDVDDCAAVAEHLRTLGLAMPGAVFIGGASAGGYTALQAACRPGPFSAATATSAIIDPARWELSVPAFQRPHAAVLRGPAGAVKPSRIRCPVLVIHGSADTITSADEAMQFAQELAALDANHTSVLLEGGDHYLSAPADREQALRAELDFYRRIMSRSTS
ncbi:prolyl oligopeptidase family serine peptidase [Kitasatospora aureofaciens]|uniref:S9 family peptidase n=1 Tax=Kitasatospora aureofaciens TaxID=1894 RepID=UPI001C44E1F7|nr:prolyl oligopeptidase family serine peptidase [Kitasatospora aureofaciens]MBV6695669.1 prolyl oligopeptidase family serine peptidase [Kitasatospora aureofaciens]